PASDWFSVGVLLFLALTGRHPRTCPGFAEADGVPLAPQELAASVPDDLNRLCVALLQPRPEDRPHASVILRWLGNEPERPGPAPFAPAPRGLLVGREPQVAALEDAFGAARAGRTVTALVHGRSGFGKSALLQAFLDRLRDRGQAVVLVGRCFEQESVPFKAL